MNGLLIVDKPGGMTSHDVVNRVRRITNEKSVGHLGTLDPMATGVLPLLLGKWTRLSQFFGKMEKSYTGTIRFGFATDTYDADGRQVGEHQRIDLDGNDLEARVLSFIGETLQMPPAFSAKKIAGKSAHTLARAGKPVDLKAVPVTVHHFAISKVSDECASFEVKISAGGYIRSLAHDLGQQLGCGAHLASLRRTTAGPFTLDQSFTLEQLVDAAASETLAQHLPHPRTILPTLPATTTDAVTAGRIRNGSAINLPEYSEAELVKIFEGRDHLLGIGKRIAGTLFQPIVVLG
jgi:tRNA pseudouridine55 synthase